MPHQLISIRPNAYKDSIRLLEATRAVLGSPGVTWGWALMATPANLATLAEKGFTQGLGKAGANDLVLAVEAGDEVMAKAALEIATQTLFGATAATAKDQRTEAVDLRAALQEAPQSNVAIISVPGPFAALEAHKALSAGLHVLLFSDNVPLEDEIALKQRAQELGLLIMGPGAGTAMLGGTGLGFSNRVSPGPVGILAAAGTGAQEVMSLLERWGAGVSQVIGLGGRDLSPEVGGRMAESAIRALDADPQTQAILLVSKPPSPQVAARLLALPRKPMVAALIGLREPVDAPAHVKVCNTLEQGALLTLQTLGKQRPDVVGALRSQLQDALQRLKPTRTRLVGLFSGGTLCYEAMTIATPHVGPIHSNTPLDKRLTVEAAGPGSHVCLDLGEEEYTKGRPHPMIDTEARMGWLRDQAKDATVAVVLLDVVIGDGAHADPAGVIAPVAAEVVRSGAQVVAYVLGTGLDPQGLQAQRQALAAAGCIVTESAARAALAACALIRRKTDLVSVELVGPAAAAAV